MKKEKFFTKNRKINQSLSNKKAILNKKNHAPFSIWLWIAITVVITTVIGTIIIVELMLGAVEKNLPNTFFMEEMDGFILGARYLSILTLFITFFLIIFMIRQETLKKRETLAVKEIRKQSHLLNDLIDNIPLGVILWDKENVLHLNRNINVITGYTSKEIPNLTAWFNKVYPDPEYRAEVIDEWEKTVGMKKNSVQQLKITAKDGGIKDIEFRLSFIDERRMLVTMEDVTEKKKSEDALRTSEEHMRAILVANPDPMVMYDTSGRPEYINPAFTKVFGWTLNELKGKQLHFVPDEEMLKTIKAIKSLFKTGKVSTFETKRLTKSGDVRNTLISASLVIGKKGEPEGMMVNLTDITDKRALEAQYHQAQKMESLGTLAGGIAHDFNNLLMGIQGRISILTVALGEDASHMEHLKAVEEYVGRAADLTKQLLGFARGGKYEVKPIDINRLVHESAELYGRTKKEIQIKEDLKPDVKTVEGDRRQLEQVLLNLYVNAWQAMPRGGMIHITTANETLIEEFGKSEKLLPGEYVKITVVDTGRGMDDIIIKQIFDPFFTTKEKERGTGLGLASAYGIIKNHGGIITVKSEVGRGSTFTIYLPASDKEVISKAPMDEDPVKGKETILLIDDEEMILDVASSMLEVLGYKVTTATNGKDGIKAVQNKGDEINLIILDLIMPGMDGETTFDGIRKINADIPVLLSSGYALDGQANAVMKRGCGGFIQKPFNIKELSVKVRAVLEDKKPSSAH